MSNENPYYIAFECKKKKKERKIGKHKKLILVNKMYQSLSAIYYKF